MDFMSVEFGGLKSSDWMELIVSEIVVNRRTAFTMAKGGMLNSLQCLISASVGWLRLVKHNFVMGLRLA